MPVKARWTPFRVRKRADLERRRRVGKRVDQLVRAFVSLPTLADAAIDDLFQVIAAREGANLRRANACVRVTFDQHPQQLAHLVHIVTRLPLGSSPIEDVAGSHVRVQGARRHTAPIALLPDDAEVAELEA